ncbi:hypothetical protein [Paracoccus sp. (in: a-proteobacteria)]|uniref:putative PDDEXK endonuclease n=1 Tax=Paracoccus sp. TaxID=267 RepID=UPI002AFFC7E7|nr:hypothetical protein [Paracoccus sp. (in: a-proteobacteria)]
MNAPRINSRQKGAAFERAIAKELLLLTGVTFKRELEQYRASDHGDLVAADHPAWPFIIECKAYADGTGCKPEWKAQASKAAVAAGKQPAVIYKFNRRPIRCAIPLSALCPHLPADEWAEISLEGLAMIASERMAG